MDFAGVTQPYKIYFGHQLTWWRWRSGRRSSGRGRARGLHHVLHHLRVERGGDGGGLPAVREVILQATLDHVVVVQPAVGSHHARLLIIQNLMRNYIDHFDYEN